MHWNDAIKKSPLGTATRMIKTAGLTIKAHRTDKVAGDFIEIYDKAGKKIGSGYMQKDGDAHDDWQPEEIKA